MRARRGKHPHKLRSVGRPLAGHDMRIIDEDGNELPHGSTGEIVGRSPTMMVGYLKQPEKSARLSGSTRGRGPLPAYGGRRPVRRRRLSRADGPPQGYDHLRRLQRLPGRPRGGSTYASGVKDVAVTGVPSSKWCESPVVFVIRKEGSALEAEQLMVWSWQNLDKAQRFQRSSSSS